MTVQWFACKENTEIFIHREKALLHLQKMSLEQISALLLAFDFNQMLQSCMSYFGEENICWSNNQILYIDDCFHLEHALTVHPFMLETAQQETVFSAYLMRMHPCWCLFQENEKITWIYEPQC